MAFHKLCRGEFIRSDHHAFEKISNAVKNMLGKKARTILKTHPHKRVFRVELSDGVIVRVGILKKWQSGMYCPYRLQMIAYDAGVMVPKLIAIEDRIEISEWIDGVELYYVKHFPEPNARLGKLMGRLNLVKSEDLYLANSDINNTNFIWTKKKELYFIDFGRMRLTNYEGAVNRTAKGVGKRVNKYRRKWFYDEYAKYHDINEFIKLVDKYNRL